MGRKVVLTAINAKYIHTSPAIRSLRANAGNYGEDVELCEYTINHRREEILAGLYEKRPEAVGFSCYLWNIEYVLSIAADLKKVLPELIIVAGGPEVSYHPEEILEQHPCIDLIMVGEGEQTFREYLSWLNEDGTPEHLGEICGLVYRQRDKRTGADTVRRTPPRQGMKMDDLVFPYNDLTGLEHRILYYESMRGCPFSCSYCLSSIEKSVRKKDPAKTMSELDFFIRRQVPQVKFVDRTFNCDPGYAHQIWRYIGANDNGITNFHFEIGGDLLREEDLVLLQSFRPGLIQFEIGVQSANPDTIHAIRRTMDLEKLRRNIVRIRKGHNIHQHLDLIAGLPFEDYDSFRRSFDEVYAMGPDQLQLGFLKLLDGSYMNERKEEYGILYSEKPPYEVLSTKWLSYEEILRLKLVEEMVETYYNSMQFTTVMAYLVRCRGSAFDLYYDLGEYYRAGGLLGRKHSRLDRYEILWGFCVERYGTLEEQKEEIRELLTYDLFCRDYVKNPPSFVRPRTDRIRETVRRYLKREVQTGGTLSEDYAGMTTGHLYHMLYMDLFAIDMEQAAETGTIKKSSPVYLLFDYRKRNPLDHSAEIRTVPPETIF